MKHLRWSFFVKLVHGKLHLRCFTRSWICLCSSSHLRGVMENKCSEICSLNHWKIPMKKFIFSKVAGWQSATFSRVPWGFYLIKKCVKILFFACLFPGKKLQERDCATLLKTNFFQDIFQGFWLEISPGKFQNSCL